MDHLKSFLRWVYDWVTVISASVVGFIDLLGSADIAPLFPAETGLKVVAGIAVLKAVCAFISRPKEDEA
jgi:hypothetical protein